MLSRARLEWAALANTDLRGAHLDDANLMYAKMDNANLSAATLNRSIIHFATLNDANLTDAVLRSASLLSVSAKRGNFLRANLEGSSIHSGDFNAANFESANFQHAKIVNSVFQGANASFSDLRFARLYSIEFNGAQLRAAQLGQTEFLHLTLNSVYGLDSCFHHAPSSLDHDSMQRSGPLPLAFLRGVGLSDIFLDYYSSLFSQPITMYTCFISYSTKDNEFVSRLHADLQESGVRCWYAPHDMAIGSKMLDSIDEAIRLKDKLLLVLSANSIASGWVEDEVLKAYAEEHRNDKAILFPIALDDSVFSTDKPWAVKLRDQRHIGDFTQWRHPESYAKSLARVLRDLRSHSNNM